MLHYLDVDSGVDAARMLVRARLGAMGWSEARLARESGTSYNAVHEWLAGRREWPQAKTREAIERTLGMDSGALERATGHSVAQTPDSAAIARKAVNIVVTLDQDDYQGYSRLQLQEAELAAMEAYIRRLREMRGGDGASPTAKEQPPGS